jgi:pyrroloquinoline quinone (PQQ) biosynthesis protein C
MIRRMADGRLKEFRHPRRIDDERLRVLWMTRLTDKEIARQLDHHIGAVRRRAMALGLPKRRLFWSRGAAE